MKKLTITILTWFCIAAVNAVSAEMLNLTADLGQPTMLSGKQQTTYLQVSLEGFKMRCPQDRAAVNIALVIDKSGSMSGEKIEKAKEAAIMAIERLNSNDIISVVTYDSNVNVLIPATKVSDKSMIISRIRQINAGGSTALYGGVEKGACEMQKFLEDGRVNRLILLSDGLANVGPQSPAELGKLGSKLVQDGISVTTIGLGLGYNEDLMTQLAYKSDGGHYFAECPNDLIKVFDSELGDALSVVAQEIVVKIECAPGIRPVRLLGRQGTIKGQNAEVMINQIYSEHEKFIMLEVEVPASEINSTRRIAKVNVRYDNLKNNKTENISRNISAAFIDSREIIEKNTNRKVMADAVELIATERNELALELRDKGKTEEAKKLLISNEAYLMDNSLRYDSVKLKEYAAEQEEDRDGMDKASWSRQRKTMRQSQYNRKQQTSK